MNIKIGEYLLEPEPHANGKWSVAEYRPTEDSNFTKKDNAGKPKKSFLAYGCTLERALIVVASNRMKEIDETGSLSKYFDKYQDILNQMVKEIKKV